MHTYRLRVAFRDQRGLVRPPARDESIRAASLREAIGSLLSDADSVLVEGTNLAWLTDQNDNMLWTLRMDEQNAETT